MYLDWAMNTVEPVHTDTSLVWIVSYVPTKFSHLCFKKNLYNMAKIPIWYVVRFLTQHIKIETTRNFNVGLFLVIEHL